MKTMSGFLLVVCGSIQAIGGGGFSTEYGEEDLGLKATQFYKNSEQLELNSYQKGFPQTILADFKQKMEGVGNKYIKNDKALYSQFQTCQVLMTHLQLALAIASGAIDMVSEQRMTDEAAVEKIYNALKPVVQTLKQLKGSLLSRIKGKFSKSSAAAEEALKDIKNILTKRSKELIADYNNFLKTNKFDEKFKKKMTISI